MERLYEVWNESQYDGVTYAAFRAGLVVKESDNKVKLTLTGTEAQFAKFDKLF